MKAPDLKPDRHGQRPRLPREIDPERSDESGSRECVMSFEKRQPADILVGGDDGGDFEPRAMSGEFVRGEGLERLPEERHAVAPLHEHRDGT